MEEGYQTGWIRSRLEISWVHSFHQSHVKLGKPNFNIILSIAHKIFAQILLKLTQSGFTCSKLTIKTLKQGEKMFTVNNKDTGTTPMSLL